MSPVSPSAAQHKARDSRTLHSVELETCANRTGTHPSRRTGASACGAAQLVCLVFLIGTFFVFFASRLLRRRRLCRLCRSSVAARSPPAAKCTHGLSHDLSCHHSVLSTAHRLPVARERQRRRRPWLGERAPATTFAPLTAEFVTGSVWRSSSAESRAVACSGAAGPWHVQKVVYRQRSHDEEQATSRQQSSSRQQPTRRQHGVPGGSGAPCCGYDVQYPGLYSYSCTGALGVVHAGHSRHQGLPPWA